MSLGLGSPPQSDYEEVGRMETGVQVLLQAIEEHPANEPDRLVLQSLQRAVQQYRAGPLSLQQLSRIAVRRATGGVRFRARARALKLPLFLQEFVVARVTGFQLPAE